MTATYALGDRVTFTHHLARRYKPAAPRTKRVWEAQPWWNRDRPGDPTAPQAGLVMGARTLSQGECDEGYYDTPTVYYPTETFTAYLIAWHLRRKPVLVLPEHLARRPVTVPRDLLGMDQ